MLFIGDKNVSKPLLPQHLGQSSSLDQFEFWPLRRWQPARVMPCYLGALRMLHVVTVYSNNTLSCSELNGEHVGEGFRSIRHIRTPLLACKSEKCQFTRKFDLWPDLTRSNIDLGPKKCVHSRDLIETRRLFFFREALRPSGADRQGGSYQLPSPLHWRRWRNTENGRGLKRMKQICSRRLAAGLKNINFWPLFLSTKRRELERKQIRPRKTVWI